MTSDDIETASRLIQRLVKGWELFNDNGTYRWYSETKPGFDTELPTSQEVAMWEAAAHPE